MAKMIKLNRSLEKISSQEKSIIKSEIKMIHGNHYRVVYFSDGSTEKQLIGKAQKTLSASSLSCLSESILEEREIFRLKERNRVSNEFDYDSCAENDPIILAIRENCEIAASRPDFDFDGIRYE